MNKTPIYIWLCISLFSLFLIQCDDKESDDLYKKYINEGEKIYLGKTDSLVALSGIGRVQLKWYVNADPKIEETVIYWNMRQDSVKKSFRRTEKGIQADSLFIEGLSEGTYTFELINRNKSGYRSLVSTVQGEVYGETFVSGLKNRAISSMTVVTYDKEKQLSDIKISWGPGIAGSLGSKITYLNGSTNAQEELFVPLDSTSTTITGVKNRFNHPDGMLDVSSLYFFENSVDTLKTISRKEQLTIFTVNGTQTDYNSAGVVIGTVHYGDLIKSLRKNASLSNDVYECNRVANSTELPNSLLRFSLQGNQVLIDGFHEGYTITNVGNNSFSPAEHKMIAHYKFIRNDGSYAIVEEEYLPPNTNIPLPIEKQPPLNVFDATGWTVKNLFTFYQDLVVVEPYVGGGGMRFYLFNKAENFFSGYRGTFWGGWDIFKWTISYTDAILACSHEGNIVWYSWDKNSGNVIGNLGFLGTGFHIFDKVISSTAHNGLFCVNHEGKMLFYPIYGPNSMGGPYDVPGEWGGFTHILSYGSDFLAVDANGDMWLFQLDGTAKKVGTGWNKYQHITAFGDNLLALGAHGIVWMYPFDKERFWDVTYN